MEQVDVINPDGTPTGEVVSLKEAHQKGHWHRAVHVWFVNSKGEILLQLRSKQMERDPYKWDISAAGHVKAGETPLDAAVIETRDELGLDLLPARFEHIVTVKQCTSCPGYINNEYNDVYVVHSDADLSMFRIHPEEVEEIKWALLSEFKTMVTVNDPTLVSHPDEFKILLNYLKA